MAEKEGWRAVILDLDQLILRTEYIRFQAWNIVLREFRIKGMSRREYMERCVGKSIYDEIAPKLIADRKSDAWPEILGREVYDKTEELFEKRGIKKMPLATAALDLFYAHFNGKLGVCSGKNEEKLRQKLEKAKIKKYFPEKYWAPRDKFGGKAKPDPSPYLGACRLLGVEPAECIVFEDSLDGVLSAKRAGCFVVGMPSNWNRHQTPQISEIADRTFFHGWKSFLSLGLSNFIEEY